MIEPISNSKISNGLLEVQELTPVGILPKDKQQKVDSSDNWEIDLSTSVIDLEMIVTIYKKSLTKLQLFKSFSNMGLSRLKDLKMYSAPFQYAPPAPTHHSESISMLKQTLLDRGLELVNVCGDGNCFFSAVAMNMASNSTQWSQTLNLAGWEANKEIIVHDLAMLLRQAYVKELLGDNRYLYEAFISHTDIDYSTEAQFFFNPSFYNSVLGNTMPLALSTALQFSIVIFSKDSRTPIMYVTPDNVASEATAFVVYNPEGEGHYDVALPYHRCGNVSSQAPKLSVTFCKCGINKRGLDILARKSCNSSPFYAARCKCFKSGQPFTITCHCYNCGNPNGPRPIPTRIKKRVNRKHELQIDIPNSKQFASGRNETICKESWSDFENIVLNEVCGISHMECLESITKLYNDIVDYSAALYCTLPLGTGQVFRRKNSSEISSKMEHIKAHSLPSLQTSK